MPYCGLLLVGLDPIPPLELDPKLELDPIPEPIPELPKPLLEPNGELLCPGVPPGEEEPAGVPMPPPAPPLPSCPPALWAISSCGL